MAASFEPATRRRPLARLLAPALAAVALAGCGNSVQEDSRLTVYLGGAGAYGGGSGPGSELRQLSDGAELALEQAGNEAGGVPVSLVVEVGVPSIEQSGDWTQAQIAAAARVASEDSTAIAYLGEPASDATAISVPITNEAGILQVATGPVAEELLREPGGNDVPGEYQTTGERTLIALAAEGEGEPPRLDPGFAAEFEAAYGRPPGPVAAYGHAAMSLVLDSIEASDDPLDRFGVIEAALASGERDSALGSYSLDPAGLGTLGG